jgi:hypothetical protein
MNSANNISIKNLILIPALITLAITLLRLTGELMNWSSLLFNKEAGGGGALIGISWLVPIFGFYFARQLMKSNDQPADAGRVFGFSFLALAVSGILFALGFRWLAASFWLVPVILIATVAGILIARKGWPSLSKTLLAYGLAARIPVAAVMLFAIMGNWGTHYDVPPPGYPAEVAPFTKWVQIGLIPQLTIWITFTVIIGSIFGAVALAVTKRSPALAKATP